MVGILQEAFESSIANHIIRFLEHPTARMIKDDMKKARSIKF
jgi:hypothetical protein